MTKPAILLAAISALIPARLLPGDYAISVAGRQPSPDTPATTLRIAGSKALPR